MAADHGGLPGPFEVAAVAEPAAADANEDLTALAAPGRDGMGWLGQSGWVSLGYLNEPVIDGTRYALPGDRARLRRPPGRPGRHGLRAPERAVG